MAWQWDRIEMLSLELYYNYGSGTYVKRNWRTPRDWLRQTLIAVVARYGTKTNRVMPFSATPQQIAQNSSIGRGGFKQIAISYLPPN